MERKTLRYITHALEKSLESDYEKIKIGAVIVDGNYLVSSAANTRRTHPMQGRYNILSGRNCPSHCTHAEIGALVKSRGYDCTGSVIYVGRYERSGQLGFCKPCASCTLALRRAGVARAFYTTKLGVKSIEFERCS